MKRGRWIGGGLVAAGVVSIVGWCCGPPVLHDLQMVRYHHNAASISLREGDVIASSAFFGHIWGASNHCDAQVWVVVDSEAEPTAFVAGLPAEVDLPGPFDRWRPLREPAPVPWFLAYDLWKVSADGEVAWVGQDGRLHGLGESNQVLDVGGLEAGLESQQLTDLRALAAAHPPRPGRHLYVLHATDQSYAGFDLRDFRCH